MEHAPADPVLLEKMESCISRHGMAGSDLDTSSQVQQGKWFLWVVLVIAHNEAHCSDSSCHSICTLDHLYVAEFEE